MSPHPEVRTVDALLAELDGATVDEPIAHPGTSSYAVIVDQWERFKALVRDLDLAVGAPLSFDAEAVPTRSRVGGPPGA